MSDALYIAATGMQSQQRSVETIANNLANVSTPAYKRGRVTFEDLVYRSTPQAAAAAAVRGTGVGIFALEKNFAGGELRRTEQPLDLAIEGPGFLEVQDADGQLSYTRGGTLRVGSDGLLATADGHPLKGAIHIGTDVTELQIRPDGRVLVRSSPQAALQEVGRLELVRFADVSGLQALSGNLYRATERSGDAIAGRAGEDGLGSLQQGALEASNVRLIDEMVDLMAAQRAYESSVKVIQAADEMLAMSNNLRR